MKTTRVLAFIAIGALAGEVPAEEPLNNASVSGTVTAATIHSAKIVDSVAGTPLTAGTTIEVGKITKGELVKGKASGGDLPKEVSLVRGSDNVMFKNLAGLSVIGAELKDVSAEGVSIGGNTVDLTGKKLHLTDATLKEVNIDSATVPRADVDKPKSASGTTAQSAPAATETANIPLTGDYFVGSSLISM